MKCSFCGRDAADGLRVNAACLCPDCLLQLLSVSPDEKRYGWFVSALRRAQGA